MALQEGVQILQGKARTLKGIDVLKKIVICGYHGFSNSGDEALLWAMIDVLKKKCEDVHITVLSMHPESTAKLYGVDSVYRYDLFKIIGLFRSSDLFLFGGGSLLQDVTSSRSLMYYLTVLRLALMCKIKVMLYGNGIGPLEGKRNRRITRKILNKVDLITLRDDLSDKLLSEIGVNVPPIKITADPAFTLEPDNLPKSETTLAVGELQKMKYAVIAVREWKSAVAGFEEAVAKSLDMLFEKHGIISVFVPMQYKEDREISKRITERMKCGTVFIDKSLEVNEIFSLIASSQICVGMRLHTLIYATTLGVPAVALSYDPKVTAFMQSINQPLCLDVKDFGEEDMTEMLDELCGRLPEVKGMLEASLTELRDKARENAEMAIDLLNK